MRYPAARPIWKWRRRSPLAITMLMVLHEWSCHSLAKKIQGSFKVITVTEENKVALVEEITKEIKGKR